MTVDREMFRTVLFEQVVKGVLKTKPGGSGGVGVAVGRGGGASSGTVVVGES